VWARLTGTSVRVTQQFPVAAAVHSTSAATVAIPFMLGPNAAAARRRPLHSPDETEDQCGSVQVEATPYGLTKPGGSVVIAVRYAASIGRTKVASVEL